MPDRLSAVDVSFLYLEDETTPMRGRDAGVPGPGQRLRLRPSGHVDPPPDRFRPAVPPAGALGARAAGQPVWVDDQDFDVAFHVRRSALPSSGTDGQLRELAARIMSRPLDPTRPLWEVYLVEALQGGRFAILTRPISRWSTGLRRWTSDR